jgi:hypothetical protein
MGDIYYIKEIKCVYCGKTNNFENVEELYSGLPYKDEFGADFICEYCKKKNKVVMNFTTTKINKKSK